MIKPNVLAADLSHNCHQSHGSDISALATHVATSDDLEPRLLRSIDIVGDEFALHDFLFDRVSPGLDSKRIGELRLS